MPISRRPSDIVPASPDDLTLPSPLQLKALRRQKKGRLFVSEEIEIDPSDTEAVRLLDEIQAISGYLHDRRLRPFGFSHLRRTFYRLGEETGDWSRGGRLSAFGAANFQGAKASRRRSMTIDGATIVEIDVIASGLTILHGLARRPLALDRDPYAIEGLPRAVVKAFVVEAFGALGLPRIWHRRIARDLGYADDRQLETQHPIEMVRTRVLELYPLLAAPPLDWTTIQHAESELLMSTLTRLAFIYDIPGLPIHDSIIVPAHDADCAESVFAEEFERRVGLRPSLRKIGNKVTD